MSALAINYADHLLAQATQVRRSAVIHTFPLKRLCVGCGEQIPANRLAAMPNARQCVPCLKQAGDVAPIRMFVEDGEGTLFTDNPAFDATIRRTSSMSGKRDWGADEEITETEATYGGYDLTTAVREQAVSNERDRNED